MIVHDCRGHYPSEPDHVVLEAVPVWRLDVDERYTHPTAVVDRSLSERRGSKAIGSSWVWHPVNVVPSVRLRRSSWSVERTAGSAVPRQRAGFQRSVPPTPDWRTLARQRHTQDQAELNRYYWTSILSLDIASAVAQNDPDPAKMVAQVSGHSDAPLHLLDPGYLMSERIEASTRWIRMNTLLGAVSAFERYLTAAADAALRSNPAGESGWPKKVDGLQLQKHSIILPLATKADRVRTGDWSARRAAFSRFFGVVPRSLDANLGKLNSMSRMRNGLAHEFGYDEKLSLSPLIDVLTGLRPLRTRAQAYTVSEPELLEYMGVLEKLGQEIDEILVRDHIGGFEVPSLWLEWNQDRDEFERAAGILLTGHRKNESVRFRHVLGQFTSPVSQEYLRTMTEYLRAL